MMFGFPKLQEEMGELGQVMGKLAAYTDGVHPDGQGDLYRRLQDEMADVIAAISYITMMNPGVFGEQALLARVEQKLMKYIEWGMAGIAPVAPCAQPMERPNDVLAQRRNATPQG